MGSVNERRGILKVKISKCRRRILWVGISKCRKSILVVDKCIS